MLSDDGRSISRNDALFNLLVHDVIKFIIQWTLSRQAKIFLDMNKLDFRWKYPEFLAPSNGSTFNYHNPRGIQLLAEMRLALSNLNKEKRKSNNLLNHIVTMVKISKLRCC